MPSRILKGRKRTGFLSRVLEHTRSEINISLFLYSCGNVFAPSKRDSFNTRRGVRPIEIPIEKQICCDVAPHKTGVFECTKKCIFNGLSRSFEFLFSSSHSLASHPIPSTHRICDCIRNEIGRTLGAAQLLRHLMNDIVSLQPSQSFGSTRPFSLPGALGGWDPIRVLSMFQD